MRIGVLKGRIMGKRLTKEEFIDRAVEIHGDKYGYDKVEYIDNKIKVKIWCDRCEEYFEQQPQAHMSGKGCAKCCSNMKLTTESFISKAILKHGDKYGYDKVDYVNNATKVKIWCNRCEEYFEQAPSGHVNGRGCFTCGSKSKGASQRLTYDDVKKVVEDLGYTLISKEYINNTSKLDFVDNEGYLYSVNFASIKTGCKPDKFISSNKYTILNINKWIVDNNKNYVLISSKYKNSSSVLKLKCNKCNCEFTSSWNNIYLGKGCGICRGLQVGESNCLENKFPKIAKEFDVDKNIGMSAKTISYGSNKKVWWKCNKGHEWLAAVCDRTNNNGNRGCPYCSGHRVSEANCFSINRPDLILDWDHNKNKVSPDQYAKKSGRKVYWKCSKCSHEWKSSIADRNRMSGGGCPACGMSKGETSVNNYLIENNLKVINQKSFSNLVGVGGNLLSYDFYLPQYNLLIEYQGEFHERQVYKGHNFEKQQEHDHRKREYAKQNHIDLLEIWYQDFDNIETILDEYFKTHKPQINTCTYSKFAI